MEERVGSLLCSKCGSFPCATGCLISSPECYPKHGTTNVLVPVLRECTLSLKYANKCSPTAMVLCPSANALRTPKPNNNGINGSPCTPPSPCLMSWWTPCSSSQTYVVVSAYSKTWRIEADLRAEGPPTTLRAWHSGKRGRTLPRRL